MNAIGIIELTSIARGIYATDLMIKSAFIDVASATPVCPGKYLTIVHGEVSAVNTAITVGCNAADAALKTAAIEAMELRLASGLSGKGYFTFTGDVSAVEAAISAGKAIALEKGLLVDVEIIPSPTKKLIETIF